MSDRVQAIDFRFRPVGAQSWTRDTTYHYLDRMNLNPCPSFEHQSVDMMFAEMEAADTQIGVIGVPGPTSDRGLAPTSADTIADIVVAHPDRFVGFGSVESSDVESAVARLGELAAVGMRGVTIDPSTAQLSRRFDDRALYPLFDEAERLGLVVTTTMSSLLGPYMDDCRPEYADRVATDFPNLTVIIQHGGWPYALEAIGAAYKQPNLYVVPSQYIHYGFPGSEHYITALRHLLQDQLLFGSVYPNCGPLPELRQIVESWQLPAAVERKYLRDNARRVLDL
ncbi:MAG: amidohydrolase family protein [Acidimicrobiaceae bacterium]|nr:amidohydrolase family protein [Acidimicrobiaceae bacterium]